MKNEGMSMVWEADEYPPNCGLAQDGYPAQHRYNLNTAQRGDQDDRMVKIYRPVSKIENTPVIPPIKDKIPDGSTSGTTNNKKSKEKKNKSHASSI
ncbi:MAG: hypothetical protein JNJ99_01580 [Crocinitomicaceae bacterium]|nr:hypothetical protein [Crocinitomicaceae bacterium]